MGSRHGSIDASAVAGPELHAIEPQAGGGSDTTAGCSRANGARTGESRRLSHGSPRRRREAARDRQPRGRFARAHARYHAPTRRRQGGRARGARIAAFGLELPADAVAIAEQLIDGAIAANTACAHACDPRRAGRVSIDGRPALCVVPCPAELRPAIT
jgi:hypothetical protein